MRNIYKIFVLVGLATVTGFLNNSMASAYEEGNTGSAVVEGKITFKGTPPVPKVFDLKKFPNEKFCSKVDSDGKGHRFLREVTVKNGNLQDVVVYIQDITRGKPFPFNGTDVKINHCRFLVQGGSSAFVGVVVNGGEMRVLNEDADSDDPRSATGVLHNPHGLEFRLNGTNFNMIRSWPQPDKGSMIKKQVKFKEPGNAMLLYCQQHSYEQAWFYPVENPYYAMVGSEGTYSINQIPSGKYKLIAWHPILGIQENEIEVGATGRVTVNFEFSK